MTTSIDIARRIAEVNHPLSRESVHALAEILVCRKYRKGEIVLQAGVVMFHCIRYKILKNKQKLI